MRGGVVLAVIVACGGTPRPPRVISQHVTMREPGAEPRHLLRYQFHAGQAERYEIDSQVTMKMATGGSVTTVVAPTVRTTLELAVDEVSADGASARVVATVRRVLLLDDGTAPPAVRDPMARQMANFAGLRFTQRIGRDGETSDAVTEPPPAAALPRPLLAELDSQVIHGFSPLPMEAVGVGARWDRETHIAVASASLVETAHEQVLEADDATARIETDSSISAPEQVLDHDVVLKKVTGTGHDVKVWSRDAVYATGESQLALEMTIETRHMTGVMRVELRGGTRRLP